MRNILSGTNQKQQVTSTQFEFILFKNKLKHTQTTRASPFLMFSIPLKQSFTYQGINIIIELEPT